MNAAEGLDEQLPGYLPRRWPECSCNALAHGGCRCEDDGTIHRRVEFEALEHESSGYPRRVDDQAVFDRDLELFGVLVEDPC